MSSSVPRNLWESAKKKQPNENNKFLKNLEHTNLNAAEETLKDEDTFRQRKRFRLLVLSRDEEEKDERESKIVCFC